MLAASARLRAGSGAVVAPIATPLPVPPQPEPEPPAPEPPQPDPTPGPGEGRAARHRSPQHRPGFAVTGRRIAGRHSRREGTARRKYACGLYATASRMI